MDLEGEACSLFVLAVLIRGRSVNCGLGQIPAWQILGNGVNTAKREVILGSWELAQYEIASTALENCGCGIC